MGLLGGLAAQNLVLPVDSFPTRNIKLKEVIVTATQPDVPGTTSRIGEAAIRHIQAADLSDLSQLLPGVVTRNPDLNAPTVFTIRSATSDNEVNALGTAIVVDGLRMSNNTNLQRIGLGFSGNLFKSSALSGFDTRTLSPSTIESVEVIRGVPSVCYGDVTSGVVVVKSKVGETPYSVALRFTAGEKLASLGKGFSLGKRRGTLYLGADYALSEEDPRIPERAFQRIGLQTAYATVFNEQHTPFSFQANLRGYWGKDKDGIAMNKMPEEFYKALNLGMALSVGGRWDLHKSWISDMEYRIGATVSRQQTEDCTYYSSTQQVATTTRQPGEQLGSFLLPNYLCNQSVEGLPLRVEASVSANLRRTLYHSIYSHLLVGAEWTGEGNRGEGIHFDPLRPPLDQKEVRFRSYRSIPFVYQYAAFAEEKISFALGRTRTEIQAGLRITQIQTQALHYAPSADPRLNVREILIERGEGAFLSHLSVRAGWGLMHKMPVLAYLYPDQSYSDKNSFIYNDTENDHRLAVVHTYVSDKTFNSGLQLPVNRKWELGMNLKLGGITADIVWFNEYLKNGYNVVSQAEPFAYKRYDTLSNKGERPQWIGSGIQNNGQPLGFTPDTTFATYMSPRNGITQQKQGVEYTLDMGRWPALYTSLIINGGYLKVREKNTELSALYPNLTVNGKSYPYIGIYEAPYQASNLRVWEQLNTNFRFITQLPRIGLVTTLTLQAVWIDRQRRGMESCHNNPLYLVDDAGNRIAGDPYTDITHRKQLNPVYYLDTQGNRHPFMQEMATDPRFADLVLNTGALTAYQADSWGPYFLLNLRVTKQIGRYVSVAFCANNFTGSNPRRVTNSSGQYSVMNPDLYYGAELNIHF